MIAGALLFLLAICGSSYATVTISYSSNNVTLAQPDTRFNFRQTTYEKIINGLLIYTSIEASEQSSSGSASVQADGIIGVAYYTPVQIIPIFQAPPTLYLCYFNASASVTGIAGNGANAFSADVSASLSFVAKVYAQLDEVDPSGNVVSTVTFSSQQFTDSGVQTVDATRGLYYVTISSTIGTTSATIAITYSVSAVLGKLSAGDVTITPTSVESFFEVDNYVYQSASNHLLLTVYVGQLSASASVVGTGNVNTVTAGTGAEQIYVRFAGTATVNGNSQSVTVSGMSNGNVDVSNIPSTYLRGQLVGHGSFKAEIRKVTVSFPAGAASITYDPTIGFGAPNSGSFLAPSFFAIVLLAVLLFFKF